MTSIISNNELTELEDRKLLIDRIKSTYLSLNLYRHSELLDGLTSSCAFENDLDVKTFKELSLVHFFIKCYQEGISDILTHINKNLTRNTDLQQIEVKGQIRGAVDWSTTYKRRMAVGFNDSTLFVCNPSTKIYDVPENQLVKYLIYFIHNNINKIDKIAPGKSNGWLTIFNELKQTISKLRYHPRLVEVTLPNRLDYKLITITKTSRDPNYRKIGMLGEYLYNLFILNDKKSLFDVLYNQLLIPVNTDKIFEFSVYFELVDLFESLRKIHNGKRKISLLRANNKTLFEYKLSNINSIVKIYYQHVPKIYSKSSKYKEILTKYKVTNVKTNIPDIIIILEDLNNNYQKTAILEVKYGREQSYLLGTGLRDILAYLNEFDSILQDSPSAMLTTFMGEVTRPDYEIEKNENVWITNIDLLKESLKDFIDKFLKN